MNIIQRGLRKLIGKDSNEDFEILANGLVDKKDVEDPTGKFFGTRTVTRQQINGYKKRENVEFSRPEYDLPTIANAVQMDGILQRSTSLFTEQILKNGYGWVSKNQSVQKYVNKRIKEIQNLTGIPFYELISSISKQLVTYANAYVVKVRSGVKSSIGNEYELYGKTFKPIVGLFVVDASTISVGLNDLGYVVNYKQTINGSDIYWDEREIIHIAYNKIPGTLTGMTSIIPILDDIRALRKMEEEIEILGFQYSIPLYLYKVGNKDTQPIAGEIDQVRETVNNMPSYGMLVVPGHHSVEVATNNNTPVDLLSFIEHFKTRIYAGLGVSPVAMGEGSSNNRNTSQVMDVSMQTITKRYQQLIKHRLEMDLFREILLDGHFDIGMEEIEFNFPEIDLESQIKKETNIIQKWQNNIITREEARLELDYETMIDDNDTFLRLIDIPKIEVTKEYDLEAKKIASKSSNKKAIDTKVRPQNQYGKSTGRPKYVSNNINSLVDNTVVKIHLLLEDGGNKSNFNIITLSNKLTDNTLDFLKATITKEIKDLCEFHQLNNVSFDDDLITSYLKNVEIIINDKIERLGNKLDTLDKRNGFSNDISDFLRFQNKKAINLAKLLVYKSLGFTTILTNIDECDKHSSINIELDKINYLKIPPFRYNCECYISETSAYEFNEIKS